MRAAQYIHTLSAADLQDAIRQVEACGATMAMAEETAIKAGTCSVSPVFVDLDLAHEAILDLLFVRRPIKLIGPEIYATMFTAPHTDDVIYDYTVGLVLTGDHVLYTGTGRAVCDLRPGVVYMINNKRVHGARPHDMGKPTPLVFVTADFPAESMRDALRYTGRS